MSRAHDCWVVTFLPSSRCRYHEWYSRALQPGYTHITVDDGPGMCEDVFKKVQMLLHGPVLASMLSADITPVRRTSLVCT